MTIDQAQSPRLGQRTPVETTSVRMFSGSDIPEAAWPGQLIFRSDQQILQIYNGEAWEDIGGTGTTTVKGMPPPVSQSVGDTWINTDDGNKMYVAQSVGADEIKAGEWELISSALPPNTSTTHVYQKATPPGAGDVPPPKADDFWYETPEMKQYYYNPAAPGTHWVAVYGVATADTSIKTVVNQYAVSASETVAPSTGWSTTQPTRTPGTYIWFKTITTLNNGTVSTSEAALLTGNDGAQGPQGPQGPAGPQGIQGPDGPNGQTLYTWIKYAPNATPTPAQMTDDPTGQTYMGIAYNKTSSSESTVYGDYAWSLIQGPEGDQGIQGPEGEDGQSLYTWVKYADDAAGAGISDSPDGKKYIGLAYNQTTSVEQATPGPPYQWSLIQGATGTSASTITLTASTMTLVAPPGGVGTTSPTTATVVGNAVITTITVWTYSVDGGVSWLSDAAKPAGVARTGNTVTITGGAMTAKSIVVKASDGTISDTLTVSKVWDGAQGGVGPEGPAGEDGAAGTPGRGITGTTVTYQKHTSGTAPPSPWAGVSSPIPATSPGEFLWTRTMTTYSAAPSPDPANGSFSVAAHGTTGNVGSAGVGIASTAVTYQLHTNGTTAPTGTWLGSPPATTPGTFLWTKTVITYTDANVSPPAYSVAAHGNTGNTGNAGADAYTVMLTNESHVFPGSTTAAVAGSTSTQVLAYKGATPIAASVTNANIGGQVAGQITTGVVGNTITVSVTTALTATAGMLSIPVIVDGKQFDKTFSWTVSRQGAQGDQGNTGNTGSPGTSITLVTPYWAQLTKGSGAPVQPGNVANPGGPWVSPEPAYATNKDMWRTDRISYSDGHYSYTTPAMSSAYTASDAALAANTVTANKVDGMVESYYSETPPWPAGIAQPDSKTGDLWFKTSTAEAFAWTGAPTNQWAPQSTAVSEAMKVADQAKDTADGKVTAHYRPTPPWAAGDTSHEANAGDLWYDNSDPTGLIKSYYWDLNADDPASPRWSALRDDPTMTDLTDFKGETSPVVESHDQWLLELQTATNDIATTAETASGLVAMSDYIPDQGDVIGKAPGSVWFVRTRNRTNKAINPSAELTSNYWIGTQPVTRVLGSPAYSGNYCIQMTNSGSSIHYIDYCYDARYTCVQDQVWTVSSYVRLQTGVGAGVNIAILWYNAAGVHFTSTYGESAPDLVPGTWTRIYCTGTAPVGAVSFFVRVHSAATNTTDKWEVDAMLIEQEDNLGRYFDGSTLDGSWEEPAKPHNSASLLEGNKIVGMYELQDGSWQNKIMAETMLPVIPTYKLDGTITGSMLVDNTIPLSKLEGVQARSARALAKGDLVYLYWDYVNSRMAATLAFAGTINQYEANGFVMSAYAQDATATVYQTGNNTALTGITPGNQWLSATTAGKATTSPPGGAGQLVQRVGFAPSSTRLVYSYQRAIKVT